MIEDPAIFLAHALALENEAAVRYDELADIMEVHNNAEVAGLFRRMAGFSRLHAAEVAERAKGWTLPRIAPWDFRWTDPEGPETAEFDILHYQMTPHHALSAALYNEKRGRDYYASIADLTGNAEVRALAAEMETEETDHVQQLEKWLERTPRPDAHWDEDMDPPVVAD